MSNGFLTISLGTPFQPEFAPPEGVAPLPAATR